MTPMRHIAMDLFDALGKKWLAMVDRYSAYAWLEKQIKKHGENIGNHTNVVLPLLMA